MEKTSHRISAGKIGVKRIFTYLHDFSFICPGIFSLQNIPACVKALQAPGNREACRDCSSRDKAKVFHRFWAELFHLSQRIVCPSRIISEAFFLFYPDVERKKLLTMEHQTFSGLGQKTCPPHDKLRIAYLGSKGTHKGWELFHRLSRNSTLAKRYAFYHFGDGFPTDDAPIKHVTYSYRAGGPESVVEKLLEEVIDIIFLWSMIPESYSYTVHEAYCAGLPILTNENSGNIAWKVDKGVIYGKVFRNANDLVHFLMDEKSVSSFLDDNTNPNLSHMRAQSVSSPNRQTGRWDTSSRRVRFEIALFESRVLFMGLIFLQSLLTHEEVFSFQM